MYIFIKWKRKPMNMTTEKNSLRKYLTAELLLFFLSYPVRNTGIEVGEEPIWESQSKRDHCNW
jgi:hypothetical protein